MTLESYLKEVKERTEKATEGPWTAEKTVHSLAGDLGYISELQGAIDDAFLFEDINFMAHSRQDIPKLLKIIEVLREQGNYLDSAITGLLEDEEIECRGDEDCDHCFANQATKEWIEALSEADRIAAE